MTKKLTRAEKDQIIYNEGHGILHPDYYCYRTKSGSIQIRKRKESITVPISGNNQPQQQQVPPPEPAPPQPIEQPTKKEEDYDSVSNKQLLEKMLEILEKNNNTNTNQNLNDPEREKEKEENKKFIENIKTQEEKTTEDPPQQITEPREQARERAIEKQQNRQRFEETQNEQPKTRPQQRGRRFIEPIKKINDDEQISHMIKKPRGRIL